MNTKSNVTDLYGAALSYALSLACNMEDANDLVQDAFLKYYETKDTGQDTLGFLLQTIKYEWKRVSFDRSQSVGIDQFAFFLADTEPESVEDRTERDSKADRLSKELDKKVRKAVSFIKTDKRRKRTVKIYRWYLQGLGMAEVGKKLNIQTQSAKQEIINMRRFVSDALGIPMRKFTQYNCQMAV
ncbi:RNA polymerase sigma factor [Prevotella intermedia]|uniref:Sigma-70 family RNA polymerase sigma factor n=1 Tax=Prevotella intermedia TaxID=28131 RepID=A0A2A6EEU7_PREIN|nr:sigma-70 family RNA polymerase sigma factor [Prevotella intermedia]PDP59668.1 hypothetical protein CLI71_08550 [Prevotella intermedia]